MNDVTVWERNTYLILRKWHKSCYDVCFLLSQIDTRLSMFEFISKLVSRRSSNQVQEQLAAQSLQKAQDEVVRQKSKEQQRHAYQQQIEAAFGNEDALLALLLACDFADGRYLAAQHLHSSAHLEKALQATKNIDKRVAKLMQTRLDQLSHQEQVQQAAQACVKQAEDLLSQEMILANQLIELDKQAARLQPFPSEYQEQFAQLRERLQSRMNAQIELQRQLLQTLQEMQQVQDFSALDMQSQCAQWKALIEQCASNPLAVALPKNLIADVQTKLAQTENAWRRWQQTLVTVPVVELDSHEQNSPTEIAPALSENSTSNVNKPVAEHVKKAELVLTLSLAQIEELVDQFEASIEQGSIQNARQIEKKLQEVDTKQRYRQFNLSTQLKDRLNGARKQLSNLMSWAKWSGNVSRDELINTAEQLATLSLSPEEIVETVSALREQWKQMESKSGGAPKELWLRFDAACNLVYAPAAQHFQQQADLRSTNLAKAEQLLAQFSVDAERVLHDFQDWKSVHTQIMTMQSEWKKLGPIDRKDKVRIESAFSALLATLKTPLAQKQQEEISSREGMIAEVEAMDVSQKSSIDQLRSLQQRWQVQAASLPLPRRDEQQLWERFRAACDGVFEKKRVLAESADQQRMKNLTAKQAICQKLANAQPLEPANIQGLIEKANAEWRSIGHVPRSQEQQIEKEFQTQIQSLQQAIERQRTIELQQKTTRFSEGLSLCQQLEMTLESDPAWPEKTSLLATSWAALEIDDGKCGDLYKALQRRFANAIKINQDDIDGFRQQLKENTAQWDAVCLHLEILLGVDSPADLSAERLKKQVEVLQSALRNGEDKQQVQSLMSTLIKLSVSHNVSRIQRLQKVIDQLDITMFV